MEDSDGDILNDVDTEMKELKNEVGTKITFVIPSY